MSSVIAARGRGWLPSQSLGSETNCIVYHLFCIFFVMMMMMMMMMICLFIYFVVVFNCLCFNPQVLFFVHSPLHPTGVGGG